MSAFAVFQFKKGAVALSTWETFCEKWKAEGNYEAYKEAFESATLPVEKDVLKKGLSLITYARSVGFKVTPVGSNWRIEPCPVCGHRQHFSIAQNNKGEWYYNSFSDCVRGGDIFNFVLEVEKKATDFKGALDHVRKVWDEWESRR